MIEYDKEGKKDPTMERSGKDEKLQQQYKHLQDWDSIKQSKPRALRRSFTDSRTIVKELQQHPRNLIMSSPSDLNGAWKVRNNDLAVEEILRERRAAIESGKLKGRRLFNTAEVWDGFAEENEVGSVFSYFNSDDENENINENKQELCPVYCHYGSRSSSTSSYICDECMEKEMVVVVEASKQEEIKRSVKGWLPIIVLIVCSIVIISIRIFCGYGDRNEVILVPT